MIHAKNGRRSSAPPTSDMNTPSAALPRFASWERTEQKLETWIKQNPLLGLGLALAVGVSLGCLLKRR